MENESWCVFHIVRETCLIKSVSLFETQSFLQTGLLTKSLNNFYTQQYVFYELKKLIHVIGSKEIYDNIENLWDDLCQLDYNGQLISSCMKKGGIISGSFALWSFLIREKNMKYWIPNDIDIYYTSNDFKSSDDFEKFINKQFKGVKVYSYNGYYNTGDNHLLDKEKLIFSLNNKSKWRKYNWNSILNFSTYNTNNNILTTKMIKMNNICYNIIVIETYDQQNLHSAITQNFDMTQCAVTITDIEGTYYPKFVMNRKTKESIDKNTITLLPSAFKCGCKKQLQRINKYIERGFNLETNPDIITRLQ